MVTLSLSLERCLGLPWVGLVAHGADKLAAFCDCKGGAEGLNAALPPSVCVRTGLAGDLAVAQPGGIGRWLRRGAQVRRRWGLWEPASKARRAVA